MGQFVGINDVLSKVKYYAVSLIIATALCATSCEGHGRLIEPPSRASAWRYGFNTLPDYNDHELYCGGYTRQWKRNNGKCGECGDAWDMPEPRPHEHGGQWGQGVIVRRYAPGSEMTIRVELTASHMGYFEFRLCPEPKAKQDCLDRNILSILGGSPAVGAPGDLKTRFYPRNGSRIYEIKTQLPDINCKQCVLQWRYFAGNNWGTCPDGNGAIGCGPQEEFRSCSDISIGEGVPTPIRPVRPGIRTTERPGTAVVGTEPQDRDFNYVPFVAAFILLLMSVCIFVLWYLNRRDDTILIKCKEFFDERVCRKKSRTFPPTKKNAVPVKMPSYPALGNSQKWDQQQSQHVDVPLSIPVPPPRAKRLARIRDISPDESSIA